MPDRGVRHPTGTVGVIVVSPVDHVHAYRVRFSDGSLAALRRTQFAVLNPVKRDGSTLPDDPQCRDALHDLLVRIRMRSPGAES